MEQVGMIGVDSGQVIIGDPCYLDSWKGHEFASDRPGEYSYAGSCTATLSDKGYGNLRYDMGHEGAAFACATRWGDGTYPIYAEFDNAGRVISLTIKFDDDPEDTEVMDECERCGTEVEMGTLEGGYCDSCADYYAEQDTEEDES